jgi:serine/threonine protein kinase
VERNDHLYLPEFTSGYVLEYYFGKQNERIKIIELLDVGGNGAVYLGANDKNQKFAIKIGTMNENEKKVLIGEGEYYGGGVIHHHQFHIMKLRGNCNLNQYIRNLNLENKKLTEDQVCKIVESCVFAISSFHKKNYSHNDIQCKNMCLDDHLNVHLVDFGSTTEFWKRNKDFKYLKDGVGPFLVLVADIDKNNYKKFQEEIDDMIDSRCQKLTKDQFNLILKNYEYYKSDILSPITSIFEFDTSRFATSKESEAAINEIGKARNDYKSLPTSC